MDLLLPPLVTAGTLPQTRASQIVSVQLVDAMMVLLLLLIVVSGFAAAAAHDSRHAVKHQGVADCVWIEIYQRWFLIITLLLKQLLLSFSGHYYF